MHRGSIDVESKQREGTTFVVKLPVVKPVKSGEEVIGG
jgi:signal transduction histidine kinase